MVAFENVYWPFIGSSGGDWEKREMANLRVLAGNVSLCACCWPASAWVCSSSAWRQWAWEQGVRLAVLPMTDFLQTSGLAGCSSLAYWIIGGWWGGRVFFIVFKSNLEYRIWNAVRQSIQKVRNVHFFLINWCFELRSFEPSATYQCCQFLEVKRREANSCSIKNWVTEPWRFFLKQEMGTKYKGLCGRNCRGWGSGV